jgi:ectoine hydroxylase-related dioxygenase (phytanoyl-CoA dioxygenase family)
MPATTATLRDRVDGQGFVILERLLDGAALERARGAIRELDERAGQLERSEGDFVLEAPGGGWGAQDGSRPGYAGVLRSVDHADEYAPYLRQLPADLGLPGMIRELTGRQGDLVNVMFWAKPGRVGSEKPWHQDMAFAPEGFEERYTNSFTVWIAMDDAARANGCLEFVAGSHRDGVRPHIGAQVPSEGEEAHLDFAQFTDPEVVAAELGAGSAVAFGGYVAHRSAPNTSALPRRAFSYVYALRA